MTQTLQQRDLPILRRRKAWLRKLQVDQPSLHQLPMSLVEVVHRCQTECHWPMGTTVKYSIEQPICESKIELWVGYQWGVRTRKSWSCSLYSVFDERLKIALASCLEIPVCFDSRKQCNFHPFTKVIAFVEESTSFVTALVRPTCTP